MEIVHTIADVRHLIGRARSEGKLVGFVPTMGAFHAGHLALMHRARHECDFVVVSIFVNPTQFGPREDLDKYPHDLQADAEKAETEDVDVIFAPPVSEIYPEGFSTYVIVEGLSDKLEGASRPGHFRGVTSIVAKLFNIIAPDNAYFGMKDYQQLQIIKKMARDLDFVVDIVAVPTVRESDGLAMSSRNVYLSSEQRTSATVLYRTLKQAEAEARSGQRDARKIQASTQRLIEAEPGVEIDYVAVAHPETLEPVEEITGPTLVALAARVGETRLIDNAVIGGLEL